VFVALALYATGIGSPSDVGLVLAAHVVPLVGFILLGGVWADRLPRQKLIIATDLARFVLHGLLAGLIAAGTVAIWMLVVIEVLYGTAEAFSKPAQTGLLPQTVPEDEIQQAKAAASSMETVAEFAGPALATALVFGLGAAWAFAIDAATFLASAAFMARVRARRRGEPVERAPVAAELREGWAEVRSRAWVWAAIGCFSLAILLVFAPWATLGPTAAEETYGTRATFGVMAAPLAAVLFGLGGVGLALFGIWWETALAERVPPHLLSRVSAYDWMGSLALLPLGYLLAGPLGETLGAAEVLAAGAAAGALVLGSGLLVRGLRDLRGAERAVAA
jgi:MFS family permease